MEKRETVGQKSLELSQKAPETRSPIELEQEMHKEYEKNIFECIERGKKDLDGDFFIVVITKREPLLPNVLRHYFFYRISCPTPDYDQTVYHYHTSTEIIDFIWTIPSRETCFLLKDNKTVVSPLEYGLLEFVLKFDDGTLRKLAKTLNGEKAESSELQDK